MREYFQVLIISFIYLSANIQKMLMKKNVIILQEEVVTN